MGWRGLYEYTWKREKWDFFINNEDNLGVPATVQILILSHKWDYIIKCIYAFTWITEINMHTMMDKWAIKINDIFYSGTDGKNIIQQTKEYIVREVITIIFKSRKTLSAKIIKC